MAESNTTPIDYEFVRVCNPRAPRYPAAVWARHDPEILRLKMLGKDSPEILATMEKEPGFNPTIKQVTYRLALLSKRGITSDNYLTTAVFGSNDSPPTSVNDAIPSPENMMAPFDGPSAVTMFGITFNALETFEDPSPLNLQDFDTSINLMEIDFQANFDAGSVYDRHAQVCGNDDTQPGPLKHQGRANSNYRDPSALSAEDFGGSSSLQAPFNTSDFLARPFRAKTFEILDHGCLMWVCDGCGGGPWNFKTTASCHDCGANPEQFGWDLSFDAFI